MRITLEQKDIETAIKQHIGPSGLGIPIDNKEVIIEIKSHRKNPDAAFSAEIEINDMPKSTTGAKTEITQDPDEDQQAIDFDFVEGE